MNLSGLKMIAANGEQCGLVRTVLILLQLFCGIIKARPTMMPWDRGGCCFWVTVSFYLEMVTFCLNKKHQREKGFLSWPMCFTSNNTKVIKFVSVTGQHFKIWTAEQCKNNQCNHEVLNCLAMDDIITLAYWLEELLQTHILYITWLLNLRYLELILMLDSSCVNGQHMLFILLV